MKSELIGGAVGTAISAVGTGMQTNEVLQTISLIITIIGGVITFILVPLYNWYVKVKKDGKITSDEIKEGIDTLQEGIDKVEEDLDKKNGEK